MTAPLTDTVSQSLTEEELDYVLSLDEGRERRSRAESAPSETQGECSEDKLALRFSELFADNLRYTPEWGQWHVRVGSRWQRDNTLHVFSRARELCRESALELSPKARAQVESAHTVASVEKLARCDPRHVVRPEQWDADPLALCTPDGVIDLRTGKLREADTRDLFTKQTAVAAENRTPHRWNELLKWATAGDSDYVDFLQRLLGYCITGDTREQAMAFGYGPGGNGKSTIINAASGILGDYATVAPMETFTESRSERHPTELAKLRGARLVTAQETEPGRRWAESRLKGLTGGDRISARHMRQDFFDFVPQFKLLIIGNHKPALNSVDEAIRRRLLLLPFDQVISRTERDDQLPAKLHEEWPAILNWMIEGCSLWLEYGLRPPERVVNATADYFKDQDSFTAWRTECCAVGRKEWDTSANLYRSWSTWAERAGEKPGTMKAFSSELQKNGFSASTAGHSKTRGYAGLSVRLDTANAYQSEQ